jgi:hypothetical protein
MQEASIKVATHEPKEPIADPLACFDQFIVALDTAIWAEERANIALKSRSLMRALTVVIACR